MGLYEKLLNGEEQLSLVGLGYVGMPIAVAYAKKIKVVGFDSNEAKIDLYRRGIDPTKEVGDEAIRDTKVQFTANPEELSKCKFHIVAVPTPVHPDHTPDLSPVEGASHTLGKYLTRGSIVVYESTVYPGVTEDICKPILEQESGLKCGVDFKIGYSPERINPGDRKNTLETIQKVFSGSTEEVAEKVEILYRSIVPAGTFRASSIKVAEACKAIENAQRDVNISFVNELSLIFDRMGIDTQEVLEAAATKWNFLKFTPGLVGGHCIGVDPYYLMHKSQCLGYNPQVILSGRSINDGMGRFVASKTVKLMIRHGIRIVGSRVLVLGFTFKENCPDTRNTKVVDVIDELKDFGIHVDVYDPHALRDEVKAEYAIDLLSQQPDPKQYDGVILTVAHNEFCSIDFSFVRNQPTVLFDVKGILDKSLIHGRL